MIVLKGRGNYLDDKSGGDGLKGVIIRLFSKDARNCNKGRRGEDIIVDVLQRLDDSHYLINDVILPSSRGNVDHVLLTPKGIFAIETKHWEGEIICQGDEWHRRYHKGLFSTKDFDAGSPSRQVKMNAINLSRLIES
ncbi:MAG TPA: nuclease-related domain-containing protein, partial [Methanotrichaceae archaeon]|nr:nuclease-related domain-containing protein [Methanotrichaceae archaeon]